MTHYDGADIDRAVGAAFGHTDPSHEALFREAGFTEEKARLGARLMESGRYLGFEDVATSMLSPGFSSLGPDNRPVVRGVTPERIAEVAKRAPGVAVQS